MAGKSYHPDKGAVQLPTHRKPYAYNALHAPGTTRVLRLEPGRAADALQGELFETELSDRKGAPASFEALSYVWGVADYGHTLSTPDGLIRISTNLAAALQRIRLKDRSLHVWADAVCINQEDLAERGHQVKLMGQIYATARRVLIWLGPDRHHRARAIFEMATNRGQASAKNGSEALREGLAELLRCEWFSRLWVVQEYHLARSADCIWGDVRIDFKYLEFPLRHVVTADNSYELWTALHGHGFTVSAILTSTRGLLCSNERDRVYATLGLPYIETSAARLIARIRQIEPDYALSVSQTMFEYARAFVESSCTILLLAQVCHGAAISSLSYEPSWLPDLSTPAPGKFLPLWSFSRDTNLSKSLAYSIADRVDVAHKILYLTGLERADTIHIIGPHMDPEAAGPRLQDIAAFWRRHVYPNRGSMDSSQYRLHERLFSQVLVCRAWDVNLSVHWKSLQLAITGISGPSRLSALSKGALDVHEMLLSLKTSVTSRIEYDTLMHFNPPQSYWRQRRLVKSAKGLIGMAPLATAQGDIIVSLPELDIPLVLRPRDGYYLFVGTMFMPGLSNFRTDDEGYRTFEIH